MKFSYELIGCDKPMCVGDGYFILHICLAAHQKVTNYLIRSGNFIPFSKLGLKPFPALGTVSGKCKRNSSFFFRGTLTRLYAAALQRDVAPILSSDGISHC